METCGGLLRTRNGKLLDQPSNSQLLIRLTCRLCLTAMSINRTRTTSSYVKALHGITRSTALGMSVRTQPKGSLGSDRYVETSGGPQETDETLMRASNK
jgi:hypothetical protein